jgi:hypothetical protein
MEFLCVSQQGEFKNTITNFFGKVHVKNLWPKKLRKKKTIFLPSFPFDFFYRVFGRFSALGSQKHKKIFSKTRPETLKNLKKRQAGRYVVCFFVS